MNGDPDVKIPTLGGTRGQPFAADAQLMPLLSTCGDFQGNRAFEGPHRDCCPQDRLPRS